MGDQQGITYELPVGRPAGEEKIEACPAPRAAVSDQSGVGDADDVGRIGIRSFGTEGHDIEEVREDPHLPRASPAWVSAYPPDSGSIRVLNCCDHPRPISMLCFHAVAQVAVEDRGGLDALL